MKTFKALFGPEISIFPGDYSDEILELLEYNAVFGLPCSIGHGKWGFDLLLFVKERLPDTNPFQLLIDGGLHWEMSSFYEYSFRLCGENKMPESLLSDFLQTTSIYYYLTSGDENSGKGLQKFISFLDSHLEEIEKIDPKVFYRQAYIGEEHYINPILSLEFERSDISPELKQLLDPKHYL